MRRLIPVAAIAALISTGCSVNPVTGENQLILVSEGQEVQMGIQAYDPTKQSQGGEYDVDPALTEYVQNVGNRLAAVSDRELPYEFAVLNNSTPNAWALPGGKIAINRGLLTELDSEAELAAVLGHEIVHAAARHSAQAMSRGLLSQVLVVATAIATSDSDYGNLAVGGANVGAAVLNATYGRGAELESDLYGMRYMSEAGYDPQGAVTLQETFVRLSENRRTDWLSGLFASHPPSQARVEANRDTAAKLPDGGKIGKDDYAKAMRRTMQLKPAYDAYDEGRKALAEGNVDQAVALSEKALDLFNGEAHFHALRGDIRLMQKNYDWAITNYTRAIERRDDFFYYHLQRGLAKKEQKNLDGARADLDRSVELMPTAPGYYALGQIAEQRGDIDTAIQHYSVVAQGGGDYGKAAAGDLARLDMP
ncbi:MAG: M48 family metalloprotease, partial [Gammaproteobacteria bacterium]|nr:M48 family metalloprotease [Gammaproteobacteria bacterium]NNL51576.1 M48 family metalloprotease [Woeseiaceae bacterium]